MGHSWKKLGHLYRCDNLHPKLMTHAANPLPVNIEGDVYRVFFSARDSSNRSSIGAVDIDIIKRKVIQEFNSPFFIHGTTDSFYSHGVSIGNTYTVDGTSYMLFMGWQNPEQGHWFGEIGRLILNNDLTLSIESESPFMPLDEIDPISLSYPWVLKENDLYKMWYGSTETWDAGNEEMLHTIKYAESVDGHTWLKKNSCIPHKLGQFQAFSRPTICHTENGQYNMWFSYRGGNGALYRIGSANSVDAKSWTIDMPYHSIETSTHGWDSRMIEYPFVLTHREKVYMLYNGNDYGKSGFGIAELIK